MQVISTVADFRSARSGLQGSLGLVPTMGYLHEGHLALVRRSLAECDTTVVSIFVNPTQFGPHEDYATYPRDMERDLALLRAEGVDLVFAPSEGEMYPKGSETWVEVGELGRRLEGRHRPGHFRGVATVVAKLLNIVGPQRTYFGQKDGQQLAVIRRLVADLKMGVCLVAVPTIRETGRIGPEQPERVPHARATRGGSDHIPGFMQGARAVEGRRTLRGPAAPGGAPYPGAGAPGRGDRLR